MTTIKNLEGAAWCRWKDCPFYGKPDPAGNLCDTLQVAMCEKARALPVTFQRAAEGGGPYREEVGDV